MAKDVVSGMYVESFLDDLSPEQREPVLVRGANVLVEAAPGAGKTRVLVARCVHLLREGIDPAKILLLTFSRRAAEELRDRVADAAQNIAQLPDIRTFHGFAARVLAVEGRAFKNRRLLAEPADAALFAEAVRRTPLHAYPKGVAEARDFLQSAKTHVDELRRAEADALARLETDAQPHVRDLIAIFRTMQGLRNELGVSDYDDMIARALTLARDSQSAVHKWLQGRYAHILVDEFQDTDPLQLALLQCMGGEIFAVGDSAQAIYGFRGAARNAIERATDALQMQTYRLGQSYRCATAICRLAAATPNLNGAANLSSRPGEAGEVITKRAASVLDEAALIAGEVRAAIDAGTAPREIAVLLRAAEPLSSLLMQEFERARIPAVQVGGNALVHDPAVAVIIEALRVIAQSHVREHWSNLLVQPALAFPPLAVRLTFDRAKIESLESGLAMLQGANIDGRVPAASVIAALRDAHELWERDEPVRAARKLAVRLNVLGYLVECGEEQARLSGRRLKRFFEAFADARDVIVKLRGSARSNDVFEQFLTEALEWNDAADPAEEGDAVRVLTVHAAKGLEFDTVIIADANEGRFPQAWRYESLLNEREIEAARSVGVDLGVTPDEYMAEECSLWFVAVTRAKRRLMLTYSATDAEGAPIAPSRFLPIDDVERLKKEPPYRADLFFYSADPAHLLPQDDAPVPLPQPLRTTGVDTWLRCRRRFYYERLLRLSDDDKPLVMVLGTLVHRVLQRFHTEEREFRSVNESDVPRWTARLLQLRQDVWAESAEEFGSPLEREAGARSADRMLRHYAQQLLLDAQQEPFRVESVEETHTYTAGGITFSGTIDRKDYLYRDGALALRDYKTGQTDGKTLQDQIPKFLETVEDGKLWKKGAKLVNPQLALYRHAVDGTRVVSYIFLGGKKKTPDEPIVVQEIDAQIDGEDLANLDEALETAFFAPWRDGTVQTLLPAHDPAACRNCDFTRLCPGAIPPEDDQ